MNRAAASSSGSSSSGMARKPCLSAWINWPGRTFGQNLDGTIPAHRDDVGMANAQPSRERLETGAGHLVEVADRPVDDGADATESCDARWR